MFFIIKLKLFPSNYITWTDCKFFYHYWHDSLKIVRSLLHYYYFFLIYKNDINLIKQLKQCIQPYVTKNDGSSLFWLLYVNVNNLLNCWHHLLESRTPQENCWHHLLSWLNAFGHSHSNTNYGHSKWTMQW